jgi:hypothetical protein
MFCHTVFARLSAFRMDELELISSVRSEHAPGGFRFGALLQTMLQAPADVPAIEDVEWEMGGRIVSTR